MGNCPISKEDVAKIKKTFSCGDSDLQKCLMKYKKEMVSPEMYREKAFNNIKTLTKELYGSESTNDSFESALEKIRTHASKDRPLSLDMALGILYGANRSSLEEACAQNKSGSTANAKHVGLYELVSKFEKCKPGSPDEDEPDEEPDAEPDEPDEPDAEPDKPDAEPDKPDAEPDEPDAEPQAPATPARSGQRVRRAYWN